MLALSLPAIALAQNQLAPAGMARKCVVQGKVIDAKTARPIPLARVFAELQTAEDQIPVRRLTDGSGAFCFDRLDPGEYIITVRRSGYLDASYGQSGQGSPGLVLRIASGTVLTAGIAMIPSATISGRLTNDRGDPVEGAAIKLIKRRMHKGNNDPDAIPSVKTDDEGRFRLTAAPPGTYFLSASPAEREDELIPRTYLDNEGKPLRTADVETYYPGSVSLARATPITVKPGEEISGLALSLQSMETRHVSGRVSPELVSRTLWFSVMRENEDSFGGETSGEINKNGVFRIDGLPPGQYRLLLRTENATISKQLDLSNSDVDGLVLDPVEPFECDLAVHVEANLGEPKRSFSGDVYLESDSGGRSATHEPDGRFHFAELVPGIHHIVIPGPQTSFFVKRILVDGDPQSGRTLDLRERRPKLIDVYLSSRFATIAGQVAIARTLTTAATVILVDNDADPDIVGMVGTDPDGRFRIATLEPGKYRLFAFEGAARDLGAADFIAAFASKSVAIDLKEGEISSAAVPLIPAKEYSETLKRFGIE